MRVGGLLLSKDGDLIWDSNILDEYQALSISVLTASSRGGPTLWALLMSLIYF